MDNRTSAAVSLLAALDAELAAAGAATGRDLVWTAAELQARELLADTVDRRAGLAVRYERTRETKTRIRISAEIRQLDKAIMALLKGIRTDMPAPESITTIKNRRAAMARWDKVRAQG